MSKPLSLDCMRCGARYPVRPISFDCPACRPVAPSNLAVCYADDVLAGVDRATIAQGSPGLWRYAHSLPVEASRGVTLGEGDTPLVALSALARDIGVAELWGKAEYANPTGSFKDRLASVAVSSAVAHFGARVIATSSSGNAGAAAAAYAARAGLPCVVFSFGVSTEAMVAQMRAYGAAVVMVREKAHRWQLLAQGVKRLGWFPTSPFFSPVVGSNPFGVEGYKSLAYELAGQRDWQAPDWIVLPVCYGDALYGIWRGFRELLRLGWVDRMPRFVAAEIYGSLEAAMNQSGEALPSMRRTHDTAAISIGAAQGTYQSLFVLRQTGGCAITVSDDDLLHWHRRLAAAEGVFVEPSSAAGLAAVAALRTSGTIAEKDSVVCLLTASGLKDVTAVSRVAGAPPVVPPDLEVALEAISSHYGYDLAQSPEENEHV